MNGEILARRRLHTHAIVEGALLGDIAIVFLLMRAYLPVPIVRQLLWAFAAIPLVMLAQRRGMKLAITAGVASYVLFSALVGPLLALAAVDVAIAAILIGLGRRLGINPVLNTLLAGAAFGILDRMVPTVITVIVFRYPVHKLIDAAKNFIKTVFNLAIFLMKGFNAPHSAIHQMGQWQISAANHWQAIWISANIVYGILTLYLVVIVAEIVLRQMPASALARQSIAE